MENDISLTYEHIKVVIGHILVADYEFKDLWTDSAQSWIYVLGEIAGNIAFSEV